MNTITITPKRSVAGMVANATVEEEHTDELVITEHPVERGASVADHAYKAPARVTLRVGWSNSSPQGQGDENYVRDTYLKLLVIQNSRVPFDIVTGKRVYRNMLFQTLATTTDQRTEAVLMITAVCREVIIVGTQTTSLPPVEVHAFAPQTAPTVNNGVKQPKPAVPSPRTTPTPGVGPKPAAKPRPSSVWTI